MDKYGRKKKVRNKVSVNIFYIKRDFNVILTLFIYPRTSYPLSWLAENLFSSFPFVSKYYWQIHGVILAGRAKEKLLMQMKAIGIVQYAPTEILLKPLNAKCAMFVKERQQGTSFWVLSRCLSGLSGTRIGRSCRRENASMVENKCALFYTKKPT